MVKDEEAGWKKVIVSAENDLVEKKLSLEYAVLDAPKLTLSAKYPQVVPFGQPLTIEVLLHKDSFQEPKNLKVVISGAGAKGSWDIPKLGQEEKISYSLNGRTLSWNTEFTITATWEDKEGRSYSTEEKITIQAKASSFTDRVRMFSNWLINLFF